MAIDPKKIAQWDDMAHRFQTFMQALTPTTEEEGRFYHIVSAIGGAAIPNYWMLRDAHSKDQQGRVAWACRNLLELAVFAEFVIGSEANATRFAEDRLIDGHQIASLLLKMEEWEGVDQARSNVAPLITEHVNMMDAEHITRKDFTPVASMTTGELKKEFSVVNRLCSKFVHPTAWSLLTADRGPERFPDASELLCVFGVKYFAMICAAFMPHIREHGLRPTS